MQMILLHHSMASIMTPLVFVQVTPLPAGWNSLPHALEITPSSPHAVLLQETCAWYAGLLLLTEVSTPFVNFRWLLHAAGQKHTIAYVSSVGVGVASHCAWFPTHCEP